LIGALAVAGCAGALRDPKPPTPPTAGQLARIVAQTRQPAYWLGPRYRGLEVSSATVTPRGVGMTYGPWSCDSGCTDSGGAFTQLRDLDLSHEDYNPPEADPKKCWIRIGKALAVLIGCDPELYPQEMEIYTGTRSIQLTSLYTRDGQSEISVRAVVRGLRPLNDNAPWPLQRPKPLSCRELRHVGRKYRRHMPRSLRPNRHC
jgi:hypothetical protein